MLSLFDRLNLTPAERRLVVVILSIAFLVVNYWLVWPRFGDFKTISDDLDGMDRKRNTYQREIERRPFYEASLKKLRESGSVLPAGEEKIQFRSDMEHLARDVGLVVPRWGEVLPERSSGPTTNAFFEAIGLAMNQVSGTEAQFVDFLYRVGASNSTIRVKELTLVPGNFDNRAQGKTNLIGSLKLVASIPKVPAKPAATTAAPAGPASGNAPRPAAAPVSVPRPNAPAATPGPANPAAVKPRTNAIPSPIRTAAPVTTTNRLAGVGGAATNRLAPATGAKPSPAVPAPPK